MYCLIKNYLTRNTCMQQPLATNQHATIFSELHEVFVYVVDIATRQFLFFLYIFQQDKTSVFNPCFNDHFFNWHNICPRYVTDA